MTEISKTQTVLRRIIRNDPSDDKYNRPTFVQFGDSGEEIRNHELILDFGVWCDLGRPSIIMVTVEPGT